MVSYQLGGHDDKADEPTGVIFTTIDTQIIYCYTSW